MEIIRTPEQQRMIRISELEKQIRDLKKEVADIDHLLKKNLVSGGARDQLIPNKAQCEAEIEKYTAELKELIGGSKEDEVAM